MSASQASHQPYREVLAGIVERVTFHNAECGFCALRAVTPMVGLRGWVMPLGPSQAEAHVAF